MNRGKTCKEIRSSVGEKIETNIAELKNSIRNISAPVIISLMLLSSCVPGGILEVNPAITQTTEIPAGINEPTISPTPEASNTPENTATNTATMPATNTATPEASPTPETTAIPETMTQAEIRAEILAAGINLDDLASSENIYAAKHPNVVELQEIMNNPGSDNYIPMVVIRYEEMQNLDEYNQAVVTDGGWRFTQLAVVAYKKPNGDWAIAKIPVEAYHEENHDVFVKYGSNSQAWIIDLPSDFLYLNTISRNIEFVGGQAFMNIRKEYYEKLGAYCGVGEYYFFFKDYYPNAEGSLNSGDIGDPAPCSPEEWAQAMQKLDLSTCGYQDRDGIDILWPYSYINTQTLDLKDFNP